MILFQVRFMSSTLTAPPTEASSYSHHCAQSPTSIQKQPPFSGAFQLHFPPHGYGANVTQLYHGEKFLRGFDNDVREHLATEMRTTYLQTESPHAQYRTEMMPHFSSYPVIDPHHVITHFLISRTCFHPTL